MENFKIHTFMVVLTVQEHIFQITRNAKFTIKGKILGKGGKGGDGFTAKKVIKVIMVYKLCKLIKT